MHNIGTKVIISWWIFIEYSSHSIYNAKETILTLQHITYLHNIF